MKKLLIILSIVFGLSIASYSNNDGGIFKRGKTPENENNNVIYRNTEETPMLPPHGSEENQPAPIGTGIALMIGFGTAYAMYKQNKK